MSILRRGQRARRRRERNVHLEFADALRTMSDQDLRDIGLERPEPITSPPDSYPW